MFLLTIVSMSLRAHLNKFHQISAISHQHTYHVILSIKSWRDKKKPPSVCLLNMKMPMVLNPLSWLLSHTHGCSTSYKYLANHDNSLLSLSAKETSSLQQKRNESGSKQPLQEFMETQRMKSNTCQIYIYIVFDVLKTTNTWKNIQDH